MSAATASGVAQRLIAIDVMHLAYRSFYAFLGNNAQIKLKNREAIPTGAIFGVASTCLKILREERPDYLAFCMDSPEDTFRHLVRPAYKAHRKEMPPELIVQIPHIIRLLECFEVPILKQAGFEADDLIGSLALKFASSQVQVCILSKDKDFMQLVNENVLVLKQDLKGSLELIDSQRVLDKLGVPPKQVVDYLAIVGDSADNVPGVRGIGPKGALALLRQFNTLEEVLANIDRVPSANHRKLLAEFAKEDPDLVTKRLVTIKTDVPIAQGDLTQFRVGTAQQVCQSDKMQAFCKEMGFDSLLKRFAA